MAISQRALSELAGRSQNVAFSFPVEDPVSVENFARRRASGQAAFGRSLPLDIEQLNGDFDELGLRYEADQASVWCAFGHRQHPCFTPKLLQEISTLQAHLKRTLLPQAFAGKLSVKALVWHSSMQGVWNLGGDLALFTRLIRNGAREELRRYAYACIDTVYRNWTKLDLPIMTIALVQGDALGGGFEAVLTNDVIIAERQSKFGLPEILFNMFPGMGAYSFL
jgi:DSF synthase